MMDMSNANLFIWTVRVALPLVFFVLWYRARAKDGEKLARGRPWNDIGPTGNCYSKRQLLGFRKAANAPTVPECLASIKMVDDDRPRPKDGGRGDLMRRRAPNKESRGDREKSGTHKSKSNNAALESASSAAATSEDDRKHLESLLNHVAFNRMEQKQEMSWEADSKYPVKKHAVEPLTETAKANRDAQMVLKGTVDPGLGVMEKSAGVATDLFKKLSDEKVEIEEDTFSMMIEACLNAGDLESASGFLSKMETAGFCPESRLLDRVMDLYSYHKVVGDGRSPGYDWAWTPEKPSAVNAAATFNFDAYSDDE